MGGCDGSWSGGDGIMCGFELFCGVLGCGVCLCVLYVFCLCVLDVVWVLCVGCLVLGVVCCVLCGVCCVFCVLCCVLCVVCVLLCVLCVVCVLCDLAQAILAQAIFRGHVSDYVGSQVPANCVRARVCARFLNAMYEDAGKGPNGGAKQQK